MPRHKYKPREGFQHYQDVSFLRADGKRVWICTTPACGTRGLWSKGWLSFGSIRDEEEGYVGAVYCPKHGKPFLHLAK